MKTVMYKGDRYTVSVPRLIGADLHTCDAWKQRTGKEVKSADMLDKLGKAWFKAKGGKVHDIQSPRHNQSS